MASGSVATIQWASVHQPAICWVQRGTRRWSRNTSKMNCRQGRIVPVPPRWCANVHLSRFGVIPKKRQPGKWRLIVHLSSPDGASVNDFTDTSVCSLKYASVDDVAEFVLRSGQGTLLAKLDIKSAYRNIPVHPGDRHLLGMQWQDSVFVDACLPFGLRSAPKIFNATADALEWIIAHQGASFVEFIIHYLDDFLLGGSPHTQVCQRSLDLSQLCQDVGFPVMREKVFGPTTVIDFLGILIDTDSMELRLPREKLLHLRSLIQAWQGKKSCTKRQLLPLIGYLQHASTVIKPGRTFLRRMIDTSKRQVHLDAPLRLNTDFRSDITWWALFLDRWNGVSLVTSLCRLPVDQHVTTDAFGSWGCGAFCGSKWFNLSWKSCRAISEAHISVKELLPIIISCAIWAESMQHKHIRCHCDNAAAVAMINRRSSSHPLAMHLLRCLFFICAKHSITLSAVHLAGWKNTAADALSRDNTQAFMNEVKEASPDSSTISRDFLEVLVSRTPNWLSADWSKAFVMTV